MALIHPVMMGVVAGMRAMTPLAALALTGHTRYQRLARVAVSPTRRECAAVPHWRSRRARDPLTLSPPHEEAKVRTPNA